MFESEGSSDSRLILSDLEDEDVVVIPDADPFVVSPMILAMNQINPDPPELIEYAGSSKSLQLIATNLSKLFKQSGNVKFSEKIRYDLDLIYRAFVYEAVKVASESERMNSSQLNLTDLSLSQEKLKEQLLEVTSSLEDASKRANEAEKTKEELKTEVHSLQEEIDSMLIDNAKNTKISSKMKRDYETQIQELKQENDNLKEKVRSLLDSKKLFECTKNRLENQLETTNEEMTTLQTEMAELKNKLKIKSETVNAIKSQQVNTEVQFQQLELDNQKLAIAVNDYKRKLETSKKALKQLNPQRINTLENDKKKYQSALSILSNQLETTSNDLISAQNNYHCTVNLVQQVMQVVSLTDEKINSQLSVINHLTQTNSSLSKSRDDLFVELKKSREIVEIFSKIQKALGESFVGDDSNIPSYIEMLTKNNESTNVELQKRLFAIIENLIRFISNLVSNNQIDLYLLQSRDSEQDLSEDSTFKNQLVIEAARIRQFIAQNGFTGEISDKKIDISKICKDREVFDILSSQITETQFVQDYCEKLKGQSIQNISILQDISHFLGFKSDNITELPQFIKNLISKKSAIIDSVIKLYDIENEDEILEKIKSHEKIIELFDNNLRQILDYEGALEDLPQYACDFINNYNDHVEEEQEKFTSSLQGELEKLQKECENEKDKSTIIIQELEGKVYSLEEEIQNLHKINEILEQQNEETKSQLNEYTCKNVDTVNRFNETLENYKEMKQDLERLQQENKKLENLIEKKGKQSDERLNNVLSQTKEQHIKEINSLKANKNAREQKLINELKKLKAKNHDVKARLKEVMDTYEDAFKKQKETIQLLKTKNEELSKPPEKATKKGEIDSDQLFVENLRIQTFVKALQSEKQCLTSKITQLTEKCDQIQQARDNYWETQLSLKEIEFKKRESASIQAQNTFIQELISMMSSYSPRPIEITQPYVKKSVKALLAKMEDNNILIAGLQDKLQKGPNSGGSGLNYFSQENEWEKWGRRTFENVTGNCSPSSSKDLRYVLGEMIIASINSKNIFKKLESLRYQKLLLTNPEMQSPQQAGSAQGSAQGARSIIIAVLAARKMLLQKPISVSLILKHDSDM